MPPLPATQQRASVPDLASRLADLIAARGLRPGDRFLTTDEAAKHLKVRRELANRALQVLAQRGRIERSQRIGARVAEPPSTPRSLDRLHVVVQVDHPHAPVGSSSAFEVGLHAALPGCEIDVERVTTGAAEAQLEPIVRRALRGPAAEGLVLVRCDYPTQRWAADSGLPAVLHGSPYAGIDLPSVDIDGESAGRMQAEALVRHGCERLVVVRLDRTLPGDRAFMTGFRDTARKRGFDCRRIDELELAPFPDVVAAELAVLFAKDESLGIVCASRALADATWSAALESHRRVGEDLWLHSNRGGDPSAAPPFPHLAPLDDDEAQGARLGQLLAERQADPDLPAVHERVPCRWIPPDPDE